MRKNQMAWLKAVRPVGMAALLCWGGAAQAAPVTEEELPLGVHEGEFRVRWRAGASLAGAAASTVVSSRSARAV